MTLFWILCGVTYLAVVAVITGIIAQGYHEKLGNEYGCKHGLAAFIMGFCWPFTLLVGLGMHLAGDRK